MIEEHYIKNRKKLVGKYARMLGSDAAGEDVVQEAYTRAIKYFHTYDQNQPFDNWFALVRRNAFLDYQANERGHYHEDLDEFAIDGVVNSHEIDRLWEQILGMINLEKPHMQECLRLHFEKGYNVYEIGQISEMTHSNILKVIQRFRTKIREVLAA